MSSQTGRARARGMWGACLLLMAVVVSPAWAQVRGEGAVPDSRGGLAPLTSSYHHACGLRSDGTAVCWGDYDNASVVPPAGSFVELAAGYNHTCGLRGDGTVACWGEDFSSGQTAVPSERFTALAAGTDYTCGLRARENSWDFPSGNVTCWGTRVPGIMPPSGDFVALRIGDFLACGLRANGRAECWGENYNSQSTPTDAFIAVGVGFEQACGLRADGSLHCWGNNAIAPPTGHFTALTVGSFHACALRTDGQAQCWGNDWSGQAMPPADRFVALSAGANSTCGLRADGHVACWGRQPNARPVPTDAVFGMGQVAVGVSHTCQIRADGEVSCWGYNPYGWSTPANAVSISSGDRYSCAQEDFGYVRCWGWDNNDYGQHYPPFELLHQPEAGQSHACGLGEDGSAKCWGWNSNGQSTAPQGAFKTVSAGFVHSCGVLGDGSGQCWGFDGDGQATVPALPENLSYLSIQTGERHSCGLRSDGTLSCWGFGTQLGYDHSSGFAQEPPAGYFRALSVGNFYNCAIAVDGALKCWGEQWAMPATVPPGTYVSVSSTGYNNTCAIRSDGLRLCWPMSGLAMWPEQLPAMSLNRPYEAQLSVQFMPSGPGETPPSMTPSFHLASGELPPGISLNSDGMLTGTPTAVGNYEVAIEGRDGNGFATVRTYPVVVDGTPPQLTRHVSGTLGENGWYVTAFDIYWDVVDNESPVSTAGCRGWSTIDVPGNTWTCTAESAGGVATDEYFAKVDVTAPTTTLTATPGAASGHIATFEFTAADATSGLSGFECSLDGAAFTSCSSPTAVHVYAGPHNFKVRAVDAAGHRDQTPASHSWVVDPTPPVIVASQNGILGDNGWYVSAVDISWSVSDPDSQVTSTVGCNPVTLATDSPGASFTCTATSAGGTISKTVTVKRDTTKPLIQAAPTTAANAVGWYNTAVTVAYTCSDALSGVVACPTSDVLSNEGTSVTAIRSVKDAAGNQGISNAVTVNIDRTAPTLAPSVTPSTLLLNATTAAVANGNDALSGVATQSCAELATSTAGSKSVNCTVTDAAGNNASASTSYRVIYGFSGFNAPVRNLPTLNLLKPGRSAPFRWRVVDAQGAAVTNLSNAAISASTINCPNSTNTYRISEYGGSNPSLQNLGNGYYQLDWYASSSYRGLCKSLDLSLGDGESHLTQFLID